MQVHFRCGYYPDSAHKSFGKRPEDYWDAYFYTWAVKVGEFKRPFYIHSGKKKTHVTADNFKIVRPSFGRHIELSAKIAEVPKNSVFVAIPSKDGLRDNANVRTAKMLRQALASTRYADDWSTGLRWKKKLTAAHEGGSRSREELADLLRVDDRLEDADVVLVDDLFSTGASLLAAQDALLAVGANVVCAITCGKTIYNLDTPHFGQQQFTLTNELHDLEAEQQRRAKKDRG